MKKVLLNFNLKHGKRRREITKLFLTKTFIFLHFFRSFFLHLLSGKTRKYLIYCQCRRETFPLYVCAVLCCRCTIYVCIMFSVFKTCIFSQLNFVLTYMYELKTEKNKKEKQNSKNLSIYDIFLYINIKKCMLLPWKFIIVNMGRFPIGTFC